MIIDDVVFVLNMQIDDMVFRKDNFDDDDDDALDGDDFGLDDFGFGLIQKAFFGLFVS